MPTEQLTLRTTLFSILDEARAQGHEIARPLMLKILGLLFLKYMDEHDISEEVTSSDGRGMFRWALPKSVRWWSITADPSGKALAEGVQAFDTLAPHEYLKGTLPALGLLELAQQPDLYALLVRWLDPLHLRETLPEEFTEAIHSLLETAAQAEGIQGGEHYSPSDVNLLLAELLAPASSSDIYDPACGTGSLLLAANHEVAKQHRGNEQTRLFGHEINPEIAALARLSLILQGVPKSRIECGDSLIHPHFLQDQRIAQFDAVISNPPLGQMGPSLSELLARDPHGNFPFGTPKNSLELAFVSHIAASLSDRGRAVVLISLNPLFTSGPDRQIRQAIIEQDLIEAVISLPGKLLFNTTIPTAILILNKAKPEHRHGKILFVYANEAYEPGRRNQLGKDQRQKITEAVHHYADVHRFAAVVSLPQVRENNHTLLPARYVDFLRYDHFLGGNVQWKTLGEVADVLLGSALDRSGSGEGAEPVILGRDLVSPQISLDHLEKVHLSQRDQRVLRAETGDILVPQISSKPHAYLVGQELKSVLVGDSVQVIRLRPNFQYLSRYLVELLNSDVAAGLFLSLSTGSEIIRLTPSNLSSLRIPLPVKGVIELIDELHQVEQDLLLRINQAQGLRYKLFSIEDPESFHSHMRTLRTQTRLLANSLVQSDDLDFQIRNFYPFPLAYAYRTLSTHHELAMLYQEQLRVAENILAFLGSIGLILVSHGSASSGVENPDISRTFLEDCWVRGISPGHWREFSLQASKSLDQRSTLPIVTSYASLWVQGKKKKETEFASLMKRINEKKNDLKHDRGPKTPGEYEELTSVLQAELKTLLHQLAFFVEHPIRLVQNVDFAWRTSNAVLDALIFMGDHPGFKREQVTFKQGLPRNKLYLELAPEEWALLYPLISVHFCPACRTRETYMVDRWEGPGKPPHLKSFERGHSLIVGQAGVPAEYGMDFEHWLQAHFAK